VTLARAGGRSEDLGGLHLLFGKPSYALRTASVALGAWSFMRDDWGMNLAAYVLLGLSFIPEGRQR